MVREDGAEGAEDAALMRAADGTHNLMHDVIIGAYCHSGAVASGHSGHHITAVIAIGCVNGVGADGESELTVGTHQEDPSRLGVEASEDRLVALKLDAVVKRREERPRELSLYMLRLS